MPGKLVRIFSAINPKRKPEDSRELRISVLVAVLSAEIAILAMGYYDSLTTIAIPMLTLAGFAFSWRRRYHRNLLIKFILSLLVIAAAVLFIRRLATSLYDTRLPLIELLLWLQVLHSFDLPARKDLKFSLASSLTLVAAGAVLSTGMLYFAGLAAFSLAAVVSLIYFHLSEQSARTQQTLPARPAHVISYGAVVWLLCAVVTLPLLLLMPQSSQAKLHTLPLSGLQQFFGDFSGDVTNPYYPSSGSDPFDGPPQFSPDSYYGFNPYMDLRSRGNLSDDIILKVRSDGYDYYRGMTFDKYNGKGWETGLEVTRDLTADQPPFDLSIPGNPVTASKTRIQSFYVEGDLPNIIFASWRPISLYFPTNHIKVDQAGSLRAPYPLTEGTVYSVVSDEPVYNADLLRRYPRSTDQQPDHAYTELPVDADLSRVRSLATEITAEYDSQYDKVNAIEQYLKENYTYDLGVPPQEQDMDAVAYFLFEERAGYCEHFASAMAVMARSIGIPARVVTGYGGGQFNPFTGLWEVRQSDAHAWVEVYFGAAGWVAFDPTPGFGIPSPAEQQQGNWVAGRIIGYLGDVLGSGPVGAAAGWVAGGFKSTASFVKSLPLGMMAAAAMIIAGAAAVGRWALGKFIRRRLRRRRVLASLSPDYLDDPMLADYFRLASTLYESGLIRRPDETLKSFASRVSGYLSAAEFQQLSELIERQRYGGVPTAADQRMRARQLAQTVWKKIAARSGRKEQAGRTGRAATGPS